MSFLGMATGSTMAKQKTVTEASSLTYEETILADTPLVYFRCGEDDPGADGNPIGAAVDTMAFDTGTIWAENAANTVEFEQVSILPNGQGRSVWHDGGSWGGLFGTDQAEYTPAGSFTIEGWVRVNGTITNHTPIFTKQTAGSNFPEASVDIESDRTITFSLYSQNGTTNSRVFTTTTALTLDESYYVVGVFRTSDNIPRIFINGLEDTTSTAWAFTLHNNTSGTNIGVINNGGNSYRGDVNFQEIAFYNDVGLSDAQILAHYNAGL